MGIKSILVIRNRSLSPKCTDSGWDLFRGPIPYRRRSSVTLSDLYNVKYTNNITTFRNKNMTHHEDTLSLRFSHKACGKHLMIYVYNYPYSRPWWGQQTNRRSPALVFWGRLDGVGSRFVCPFASTVRTGSYPRINRPMNTVSVWCLVDRDVHGLSGTGVVRVWLSRHTTMAREYESSLSRTASTDTLLHTNVTLA